jgi:hypothetical protein
MLRLQKNQAAVLLDEIVTILGEKVAHNNNTSTARAGKQRSNAAEAKT